MSNTVQVKNIDPSVSDADLKQFLSFCGKIVKITDHDATTEGGLKSATVVFEKEAAARTALLLNNTQLGPSHITVTSDSDGGDDADHEKTNAERDSDEITQEEKPRSRILAEYLAHGYLISDAALQRAVDLDHQHGVSSRFVSTLQSIDQKYHATERAKTADQSYGISSRATSLLTGIGSYFEKAASTPTGKKIVDFYTQSSKQVQDVHAEARRLAELKKQEAGGSAAKAAGLEKILGTPGPGTEKPAGSEGTLDTPAAVPGTVPATGGASTTEKPKSDSIEGEPKV